MLKSWMNRILMDAAPGDGGASGGGALLGGDPAPAAPAPAAAEPTPKSGEESSWVSSLDESLKDNKTFAKFKDVNSLAAAYINAEKYISGDKVVVPGKHATPEDWSNVYKKLGLPEKAEDYKIQFKDGATIKEDFSKEFGAKLHSIGVLPHQAQALADWVSDSNISTSKNFMESRKAAQEKEVAALKAEWGNAFDVKLARANKLLKEHGSDELGKYLKDTGLGNDTKLIKLLAGVADAIYKEDKVVDGTSGKIGALTPGDARKQAMSIVANSGHPYNQKDHPNHKAAVKEVEDLFQQAASQA